MVDSGGQWRSGHWPYRCLLLNSHVLVRRISRRLVDLRLAASLMNMYSLGVTSVARLANDVT